jgi:hypothetical protein
LDRITNWEVVRITPAQPQRTVIPFSDYFAVGDGITANDEALNNLLSVNQGLAIVIQIDSGKFRFTNTISLPSGVIIKGSGELKTQLIFDISKEVNGIEIKGNAQVLSGKLKFPVVKGTKIWILESGHNLKKGDLVKINDDDSKLVFSSWALKSTGQIVEINNVKGDTAFFESEMRRNYDSVNSVTFTNILPNIHSGLENLDLLNTKSTTTQTSNLFIENAAFTNVSCIQSVNGNFSHISLNNSYRVNISGCRFKEAFAYGDGGQGYGVAMQYNTSECLISHNIFDRLRHSILLQAGVNGNVISYNYSINPFWQETSLPSDAAGDLVLHGNYPYLNLFEGNIVQNIVIDNSHGFNGPLNTYFRNKAEKYGLFMNDASVSAGQNFIGNEITSTETFKGFYILTGTDHLEYGNVVKGTVIPPGTSSLFVKSFYLDSVFKSKPLSTINELNKAFGRNRKNLATSCLPDSSVGIVELNKPEIVTLFPNPAAEFLIILSELKPKNVLCTNTFGIKFPLRLESKKILLENLINGFYILEIEFENGSIKTSPLIITGD